MAKFRKLVLFTFIFMKYSDFLTKLNGECTAWMSDLPSVGENVQYASLKIKKYKD